MIYSVLQKLNWSSYVLVIIWKHSASNPLRSNGTSVFSAPWKIQARVRTGDTAKKIGQIKIQEVWKVTLQESFADLVISLLKCLQGFFFWPPQRKQTNKQKRPYMPKPEHELWGLNHVISVIEDCENKRCLHITLIPRYIKLFLDQVQIYLSSSTNFSWSLFL